MRGAAHVGVLKVLEGLRVPIDCVAGTSMGAVVGGLYCSGMTPESIESWLGKTDWDFLLTDNPERKDMPIRAKTEEESYLLSREFGVKSGGLVAPGGLVAGQNLGIALEGLTIRAMDVTDFDRLDIPFRAVATDIGTCEKVVIGSGRLSDAIRASMSIPGAFSPVSWNGRLLVDGGLVDNLPVDVVRDMGADIVIAVDIGTHYLPAAEVTNMLKVFQQTIQMLTRKNTEDNITKATLLIRPDLKRFTGNDFKQSALIIALGERAARNMQSQLSAYSVPEQAYEEYRASHLREPYHLSEVGFVGNEASGNGSGRHVNGRAVVSRMKSRPGATLDVHTLQDDLGRIYSMGEFETVSFRIDEKDGKQGIVIRTQEKAWGPNYLRFGLDLQSDFQGENFYSLSVKFTVARINPLGAEWKTTAELGRPRRLFSEFYQPLVHEGSLFVAPVIDLNWVPQYYYEGELRAAEYGLSSYLAGVDVGFSIGRYGEIRIGSRWGSRTTRTMTGQLPFPGGDDHVVALVGQALFDQLDSGTFPNKGFSARVQAFLARPGWGSDISYQKVSAIWREYFSWGQNTFFVHMAGGSSLGTQLPFYDQFTLGGWSGLSGYPYQELQGTSYGLCRLGYDRRISRLPSMLGQGGVYVMIWGEAGNTWQLADRRTLDSLLYSGTLALGADTNLGPFYLAVSKAERQSPRLYLSLGRTF